MWRELRLPVDVPVKSVCRPLFDECILLTVRLDRRNYFYSTSRRTFRPERVPGSEGTPLRWTARISRAQNTHHIPVGLRE